MNLDERRLPGGLSFRIFTVFGFIAPLLTFLIALADISPSLKIILLALVSVIYVVLFAVASRRMSRFENGEQGEFEHSLDEDLSETDQFASLDEANQFFGASLNQVDMFRLVASRINEIFPLAAAAFLVPDAKSGHLRTVGTIGDIPDELLNRSGSVEGGVAGMAFVSGEIELERCTPAFADIKFADTTGGFASAAAIPLVYEGRVLAIFEIFTDEQHFEHDQIINTLKGLQTRITPLFLGAFALERASAGSFTDDVTRLPNERAFLMVLENHLAESVRFRGDRPLTVVSLDIKNFRLVNEHFGHATGDRVLIEVAERIRLQLRKMDFLARTNGDEFLAILPLAGEASAADVVSRMIASVSSKNFEVDDFEIFVDLNFGIATYWEDGETVQQLVQHAQLRKQQMKAEEAGNVVLFPKEYVN